MESNRGRSAVLYSLTGESVLLPWKLKTKDGNITSFFKKGHTFDFILNRKESLADITFEDMVRIPLKDSDIDCIMVFFTENKKYALLFFEEWDVHLAIIANWHALQPNLETILIQKYLLFHPSARKKSWSITTIMHPQKINIYTKNFGYEKYISDFIICGRNVSFIFYIKFLHRHECRQS